MSAEFPFVSSAAVSSVGSLDVFREWAWDFGRNCFRLDGDGNMILLSGDEALKVWIYHAIKTDRWAYLAYSNDYGFEGKALVGKVLTVGERRSELERMIREALLVNPYIKKVNSVKFERRGVKLDAAVEVTTVYGEVTV